MEMEELMFNHVFRNYSLPEDIISDHGPLFISHVWKSFFTLLGVTMSLSSEYHAQTNGQMERKIQEIRLSQHHIEEVGHLASRVLCP